MCGIIGAIGQRNVVPILIQALLRLEYRGYDSAGVSVVDSDGRLQRHRTAGKVNDLKQCVEQAPFSGEVGIAHTRWATHGEPSEANAHPHITCESLALVHNGIIENYTELRQELSEAGYVFLSDTDSEVIATKIHQVLQTTHNLREAVQLATTFLVGAYAIAVIQRNDPYRLVAARRGSPLVLGIGKNEYFVASDTLALAPLINHVVYLEDGDFVELTKNSFRCYDASGQNVNRPLRQSSVFTDSMGKGKFPHYMLKEIFEQPHAVANTLEGRIGKEYLSKAPFGLKADAIFQVTRDVQIIACGTSYHAALVARYWFESIVGIRCHVDFASEFRYRQPVISANTLIVSISQSGETADTLAALKEAKTYPHAGSLAICNVPESAMVRASDITFLTRAGPEIGVASTKAFTTQLTALLLLVITIGKYFNLRPEREYQLIQQLHSVPDKLQQVLALDKDIQQLAKRFAEYEHALFLGRGPHYPIAMEGALKLKEISYIHAEAYPAGELKHGPLALVDERMPVIAVAPYDKLIEKMKSNMEEVRSRGGQLIVFADVSSGVFADEHVTVIPVTPTEEVIAPIIYTVPLQLLAYHVAMIKGTNIDQPRNLAKSVTVE